MAKPTAGALCSVLLGMEYLEHDDELLVANADQWIDVPIDRFLTAARAEPLGRRHHDVSQHASAMVVRRASEDDLVVAVAEKQPISRHATAGLYYFRRGIDFVRGAERMLFKNASRRRRVLRRAGLQRAHPRRQTRRYLSDCRVADARSRHAEEVERFQARAYARRGLSHRMLNIVLPIAGRGSRFADAGLRAAQAADSGPRRPDDRSWSSATCGPACRTASSSSRSPSTSSTLGMRDALDARRARLRSIVPVDQVTEGAACTVLLAREFIDTDDPLMLANSDQWVDVDIDDYLGVDGSPATPTA